MPTPLDLACFSALKSAAESPFGVVLRVESPPDRSTSSPALRAKQSLYALRKTLADPIFDRLQIRLSPDDPDKELWIINHQEELNQPLFESQSVKF